MTIAVLNSSDSENLGNFYSGAVTGYLLRRFPSVEREMTLVLSAAAAVFSARAVADRTSSLVALYAHPLLSDTCSSSALDIVK